MKALILTEKPKVALKIAQLLGKSDQKRYKNITYFEARRGGDTFSIIPLVGHVVSADFPRRRRWFYPDIPTLTEIRWNIIRWRGKFLELLKNEAPKASQIIVACDLDPEGSLIALEALDKIGWEPNSAARMEFSATTENALRKAFDNLKPFDYPRAMAGRTRALVDLYWGYNVTRALTLAAKGAGLRIKVFSGGRVQSPLLASLAAREQEISSFVPEKFFKLVGIFEKNGERFEAIYFDPGLWENTRFRARHDAEEVAIQCRDVGKGDTRVKKITVERIPPMPFNLTSLQAEAYSLFGLAPQAVGNRRNGIAQRLYEAGLCSYPGTASERYQGFTQRDFKIMLERIKGYPSTSRDAFWVISTTKLTPAEGKRSDPAHPCIHITGTPKEKLRAPHEKIYELIARRNLATFSPPSLEEHTHVSIFVDSHEFRTEGKNLLEEGWIRVYRYRPFEPIALPPLETGESVRLVDLRIEEKETKPPKRLTPASVIKMMESLGIGTKNTRHEILNTLYERGYVRGKRVIQVTAAGMAVASSIRKNLPIMASQSMSAELENSMEKIEIGELDHAKVLDGSLENLKQIMSEFKSKEKRIGDELRRDIGRALEKIGVTAEGVKIGECPSCREGTLRVVISRKTGKRFIGCSRFRVGCKQTYPLPQKGELTVLKSKCECGLHLVEVKNGKVPLTLCVECGPKSKPLAD